MSRYHSHKLGNLLKDLGKRRNGKVALPAGFQAMPVDLPAYIEVGTMVDESKGLLGHIVTHYYYTVNHVIEVKDFRDPRGIEILVDGKRVFIDMKPKAKGGLKKVAAKRMSAKRAPVPDYEVFDDDELD